MVDRRLLKVLMKTELSDLIFNQHMKSYMPLNIFIISMQLIMMLMCQLKPWSYWQIVERLQLSATSVSSPRMVSSPISDLTKVVTESLTGQNLMHSETCFNWMIQR